MTLEATPGADDAVSYLTLDDADALAAADFGPERDRWVAEDADDEARERALMRATREIDEYLRSGYPPYTGDQALLFPRSIDAEEGSPVIPKGIQNATYYLAAFLFVNAAVIARADARKARGQTQYSEPGNSGTEREEATPDWPDRVHRALAGFSVQRPPSHGGIRSVRLSGGFVGQ